MTRRAILAACVAASLMSLTSAGFAQQGYPTRPIRLVAPYPAGGGAEPVHQALGHAQRPLDRTQLQAKFVDALAHGRYEGDALALFERLSTLDRQEHPLA